MKILKLVVLISMLFFFPAYSYSSSLGSLRISYMAGDVQIKTEETDDWVPASINMPLRGGDRLWVPEGSRTELQLVDGTVLRLDQESALDILALDKDASQFYLNEGYAYANFAGARGSLLQIDTPQSSVRAYENSVFRIDISRDGQTDIGVYKGSVYAESPEGRTRVSQGNTLSLGERGYAELSPMGPSDEWEKWNMERNRRFAERPPSRYLPEELYAYSGDFEQSGRWVTVQEYGPVWTPTVVAAGWAPYRVGRWVWIGGEYVWISHEPWGWVPFHYGRWAFVHSVGWCWVPPPRRAVFWSPGFVGWVHTPTHVSWVPLAPGEIYYGRGYYGPHSVNITTVNITNIQVNKIVYRNIHVHNAVTVIHHDTFVRGRHVEVRVKENPFLRERISIGGPSIKPERATLMPVIKEIPERRRPPAVIREIKVKEIRERRPLIRERERSVLRPESPPRELPVKPREGRLPDRGREPDRKERKTLEREREKPSERRIEKDREIKLQDRGSDKPGAGEKRIERERDIKLREKGADRPGPAEKRIEKEREIKLQDRGSDKPGAGEKRIERERDIKPREKGADRPGPAEKRIEKEREIKLQEKGSEKRIEKEKVEKERGREKSRQKGDEKGGEKE